MLTLLQLGIITVTDLSISWGGLSRLLPTIKSAMDKKEAKQNLAVVATLMEVEQPLDQDNREFVTRAAWGGRMVIEQLFDENLALRQTVEDLERKIAQLEGAETLVVNDETTAPKHSTTIQH